MTESRSPQPTIGPVDAHGGLFGRVAMGLGFCTAEQLTLAVIAGREPGNESKRMGELLAEAGVLTPHQVQEVLAAQSKAVMRCGKCGRQFNVPAGGVDGVLECPDCQVPLELPVELTAAPVDRTLDPEEYGDGSEDDTVDPEAGGGGAAPRESYSDLEGTKLGTFDIGRMIGEGGMGAVFLAKHLVLKRPVALKVLPADLSHEKARVRRFLREAEAMAQVEHDNIVRIHNVGSDRGFYFIEMEVVRGGTLLDVINRDAPMPLDRTLELMKACASGLAAAHERGIIHRDIKPENVLLTEAGEPKIADFGLAKAIEGASGAPGGTDLTGDRAVQGTPAYMSPEQCKGEHADARSDVYALGVVLFEMLTKKRPFEGSQPLTIILRRLKEEAPSPRSFRPDLPLSLSNVVERMLAKDPDERYQTATEVLEALEAFERGEEIAYTARRIRLRRARIAVTSVVLVLMGVVGTLLWQRFNQKTEIKIIEKGETRGQAITRLEREAKAAYLAGDDAEAKRAFGELAVLAKAHPALAWRPLIDDRDMARQAWAAGDLTAAGAALLKVLAGAPEDTIATGLQRRVELLTAARAAMGKRDAPSASAAALELLELEPGHAEAERIHSSVTALAEASARLNESQWREALRAADAAAGYGAAPGWTAEVLETACDKLSDQLTAALTAKDAARARPIAVTLKSRTGQAASAATAVAAYERAAEEFDREWRAGERHLEAGQGADALRRFKAAAAIFDDPRLPDRLRDARVWVLRRSAAEAAGRGELERAIAMAGEASTLSPDPVPIQSALRRYRLTLADRRAALAAKRLAAGDFAEAGRLAAAALEALPGHAEASAVAAEVDRNTRTPDGFVYIPTLEALLPDGQGGTTRRKVQAYYIARVEVTNAEFQRFVDAGGYGAGAWWGNTPDAARAAFVDESGKPGPAEWTGGTYPAGADDLPVVGVSWAEAAAYAQWKNARLPTEAEWLAAAGYDPSAGRFWRYPWGDDWDAERVGYEGNGGGSLAPAGSRTGDRSNWGCLDMAGNVMEWTAGAWADGSPHRLILGGSLDPLAAKILNPERGCRLDRREARADPLTARLPGLGFRLAKSATEGGH